MLHIVVGEIGDLNAVCVGLPSGGSSRGWPGRLRRRSGRRRRGWSAGGTRGHRDRVLNSVGGGVGDLNAVYVGLLRVGSTRRWLGRLRRRRWWLGRLRRRSGLALKSIDLSRYIGR